MAKESDVSWIAGVVGWGMPLVVIPLGIPIMAGADLVSRLFRRKGNAPDYRDTVSARIEYFRTHPADPTQYLPPETGTSGHPPERR